MNSSMLAHRIAAAIPAMAEDCAMNNALVLQSWIDQEVERDRFMLNKQKRVETLLKKWVGEALEGDKSMFKPKKRQHVYKIASCMICHSRCRARTNFARHTGLTVCKRKNCRKAFLEAGIV